MKTGVGYNVDKKRSSFTLRVCIRQGQVSLHRTPLGVTGIPSDAGAIEGRLTGVRDFRHIVRIVAVRAALVSAATLIVTAAAQVTTFREAAPFLIADWQVFQPMSGRRRNLQAAGRVERASERVGVLPRNGELLRGSVQGPYAACGEAWVRQRGLGKVGHHGHHCTANNKCVSLLHKFIICKANKYHCILSKLGGFSSDFSNQ